MGGPPPGSGAFHSVDGTYNFGYLDEQAKRMIRVRPYPVLLDEPMASLDAANRAAVGELIAEARAAGSAIVGIFHDDAVRAALATTLFDITRYKHGA